MVHLSDAILRGDRALKRRMMFRRLWMKYDSVMITLAHVACFLLTMGIIYMALVLGLNMAIIFEPVILQIK